jgi:hypothetical protein
VNSNSTVMNFKTTSPELVEDYLERVEGFEPSASCMASRRSTAELYPRVRSQSRRMRHMTTL